MRDIITTGLDVLGLLLVAAGVVFFLWPYVGGGALAIAGGLIITASALADRPRRARKRKRDYVREAGR